MKLADTLKAMSDHQIHELVIVMLSNDHRADDKPEFYVAVHAEAMNRPAVKFLLEGPK